MPWSVSPVATRCSTSNSRCVKRRAWRRTLPRAVTCRDRSVVRFGATGPQAGWAGVGWRRVRRLAILCSTGWEAGRVTVGSFRLTQFGLSSAGLATAAAWRRSRRRRLTCPSGPLPPHRQPAYDRPRRTRCHPFDRPGVNSGTPSRAPQGCLRTRLPPQWIVHAPRTPPSLPEARPDRTGSDNDTPDTPAPSAVGTDRACHAEPPIPQTLGRRLVRISVTGRLGTG